MKRDQESIWLDARKCFYPRPTEDNLKLIRLELLHIAEIYRENRNIQTPEFIVTVAYRFEERPEQEHEIVCPPPRLRGRPKNHAANMLVYDCRELLIRYGCSNFAASGNRKKSTGKRYDSRLEKLVNLVHELAEFPPSGGWRQRVEDAPNWQWQYLLLHGPGAYQRTVPLALKQFWTLFSEIPFPEDPNEK